MIITAVLQVVLTLISTLFNLLPSLPSLPDYIVSIFDDFSSMLMQGLSFFCNYVDTRVMMGCLVAGLAIHNFNELYNIIIWFLKKIPFINIK